MRSPPKNKKGKRKLGVKRPVNSIFLVESGAGNEVRTRDLNLGKVALYQLSYSRIECEILAQVWSNARVLIAQLIMRRDDCHSPLQVIQHGPHGQYRCDIN